MLGAVALVAAVAWYTVGASSGQSKESAEAGLLAIPGISEAMVTSDSLRSGLQLETSTIIEVELEPGAAVTDPNALVDYLLRVAWSARTKEAKTFMVVQVISDPQFSVKAALEAGGWDSGGRAGNPERGIVFRNEIKEHLGDWPGEVPELPAGLIAAPTATPTP